MKKDLYVITKFIFAGSAQEALEKEKKTAAHEVWIESDWKKNKIEMLSEGKMKIGFEHEAKN